MKTVYLTPLLLLFLIPQAFAYSSLENQNLFGQSATVLLDIQFGEDLLSPSVMREFTSTLEYAVITFYGQIIDISDSNAKVYSNGKLFSIANQEEGILMYGKYNPDLGNYMVNVYVSTADGFKKYPVSTAASLPDEETEVAQPAREKPQYIPNLDIVSSHDFKTYWRDTFDIEVMAYDRNINARPELNPHQGKVDGVNVDVILSHDGKQVAKLNGMTEYGQWKGSHFFADNISTPGEYIVDVVASYLGKTASKTSSMFVIGTVPDSGRCANFVNGTCF